MADITSKTSGLNTLYFENDLEENDNYDYVESSESSELSSDSYSSSPSNSSTPATLSDSESSNTLPSLKSLSTKLELPPQPILPPLSSIHSSNHHHLDSADFAPLNRSASFPVPSSNLNSKTSWPELTRSQSISEGYMLSHSTFERQQKAKFVDNLIGIAVHVIETIWINHSTTTKTKILPLPMFITETLRRSRTSCSTLQTALLYLFRIKHVIIAMRNPTSQETSSNSSWHALCGRRMFLAALISASKFLQDRNFSNRAWAKLTGLSVSEINANELSFLRLINYNLFVKPELYHRWNTYLAEHIHMSSSSQVENSTHQFKHGINSSNLYVS